MASFGGIVQSVESAHTQYADYPLLFAFGYLFGFAGLLIAIPAGAAVGVLTRFALRQYYASPFYAPVSSSSKPENSD